MRLPRSQKTGLDDRQEKFCRLYVKNGGNASDAYRKAGYNAKTGVAAHASRLLARDKVQAYVVEFRRYYDRLNESSEKGVLEKMRELYEEAREQGALNVMVKLIDLEGRYHNMWSDKLVIETKPPETISKEDVPKLLAKARLLNLQLARTHKPG